MNRTGNKQAVRRFDSNNGITVHFHQHHPVNSQLGCWWKQNHSMEGGNSHPEQPLTMNLDSGLNLSWFWHSVQKTSKNFISTYHSFWSGKTECDSRKPARRTQFIPTTCSICGKCANVLGGFVILVFVGTNVWTVVTLLVSYFFVYISHVLGCCMSCYSVQFSRFL